MTQIKEIDEKEVQNILREISCFKHNPFFADNNFWGVYNDIFYDIRHHLKLTTRNNFEKEIEKEMQRKRISLFFQVLKRKLHVLVRLFKDLFLSWNIIENIFSFLFFWFFTQRLAYGMCRFGF